EFDGAFLRRSAAEWQRRFEAGGFTVSVVARLADVPGDEQAVHADALIEADGMGGTDRTVDSPIHIAGVQKVRPKAPPAVGQHSREVLRGYGLDEGEIDALVAQRVVA